MLATLRMELFLRCFSPLHKRNLYLKRLMEKAPNILLVDDEERFAESLQTILNHYGYNCTYAINGNEAITHLKERMFDVVLLDVGLPDMSGCKIAEHIKTTLHGTSAIMLTGMNTVETAVEAMQNGAYDFLSKPIKHDLLIKTIDKALEHNRLTKQLETSNSRFQAFAEATWEGIVIHDIGRLIEANRQFWEMFGYEERELLNGELFDRIFAPESLQAISQLNGDAGIYECIGKKKDGTEFPVEVNVRQIDYLNIQAAVCTIRDITSRVRAEEEKLILQSKLGKAQKLKALGLMAGSVAHDLNNILTGLVTYPDLLLYQMGESNKFYPSIKKIQESGKRASAVVNDLIMLARGRLPQANVENINEIILRHLQSIEHTERQSRFPNVIIQTQLQSDLLNCYCSPQHIIKILMNLVGNALEAVGEDGLIQIRTENCVFNKPISNEQQRLAPAGEYIKLTITDNGSGIKEKDQVFDPFFTTKKMGKSGTGLGLTIVWNTIQEHNGWIELKDNNPGARFEIYLPGTRDDLTSPINGETVSTLQGSGERILLIDDETSQNELMTRLLANLGYRSYSVTSGEEGLEFLQDKRVDLVVLDMIMGEGLTGRQTFERILKINPSQKAIVISGYADNKEIRKIKKLGVSYILEKPVTMAQIGLALKKSLSGY